jgi:hypothetical protein
MPKVLNSSSFLKSAWVPCKAKPRKKGEPAPSRRRSFKGNFTHLERALGFIWRLSSPYKCPIARVVLAVYVCVCLAPRKVVPEIDVGRVAHRPAVEERGGLEGRVWQKLRPEANVVAGEGGGDQGNEFRGAAACGRGGGGEKNGAKRVNWMI